MVTQMSKKDQQQQQESTNSKSFWLEPTHWAHIKWPDRSIYNIYDFPSCEIDIDFNQPELSQATLTTITEQVEQECSVGAYFNIKGTGEGVVWTEWTQSQGDLTFKVKGRQHLISQDKVLVPVRVTRVANMKEFFNYACTENRMRQALDYMREQKVSIEATNANIFLRWLTEDIIKEEKDVMNASGIDVRSISSSIHNRAHPWFIKSVIHHRQVHRRKQNSSCK
ncbi:unnamed protein product [Rotaria sordida]|uniref:Uncharacterized protein n=1 Tax=Rotaria sordida TaxID=392033 RepID=A0A815MGG9_9BILA|nr:unnamed protein product [Rotaria sordida]CAF1420303.1 unnamed protein product [Rotaria sordida]